MKRIPLLLFFLSIFANAQEAKYKQALDSIAHYIKFTQIEHQTNLLTYYKPNASNYMSEKTDSLIYLQMAYNYKTKVVLTDGNTVYMIDFKQADTSFFSVGRRGLRIMDPSKKVMFMHSNTSRLFNGKIGGVAIEQIDLNVPRPSAPSNNVYNINQLIYFLKQATLYSKKVRTKKKDIWTAEGYE